MQRQAAIALLRFRQPDWGWCLPLDRLLRDPQADTRAGTLEALGESSTNFDPAPLVQALQDSSAIVRRAACHALAQIQPDRAIQPLADRLSDADPAVRETAAQALQRFGSAAAPAVLHALNSADDLTQAAALDALTSGPAILQPLRQFVQREIERLRWLRRID